MSHPCIFDFTSISPQQFLTQYWQKQPLLIKQALPEFESPIDADELAGLSLEPEIESRIILGRNQKWHLKQGPFVESDYSHLPQHDWTLLVQGCDQISPEVQKLTDLFHFLPRWLLDDIMISFAVEGGSVGPHFDQFDVFLLQAQGKRQWKVANQPSHADAALLPELSVRVLETMPEFTLYEVEAGDILYIPAGFAHHGESIEHSISLSFGYRAPSIGEAVAEVGQLLDERLNDFARLKFPQTDTQNRNPHAITDAQIDDVQQQLLRYFTKENIAHWLGSNLTALKHEIDVPCITSAELETLLQNQAVLIRQLGARLAYHDNTLFANGQQIADIEPELANYICKQQAISYEQLEKKHLNLLTQLVNIDVFYVDQDEFLD